MLKYRAFNWIKGVEKNCYTFSARFLDFIDSMLGFVCSRIIWTRTPDSRLALKFSTPSSPIIDESIAKKDVSK